MRTLRILGTRGVPAAHGGFETFAERLALYLVGRGWRVVVYGQDEGHGPVVEDQWQGVERVRIPCGPDTPKNTIVFDWRATRHAARCGDLCLTLGYNTAVFCVLLRAAGVPNLINMDGIEWRRAKWGAVARTWFWLNEHAGSRLANHLVADHPEIARHLSRSVAVTKITTIPYGADELHASPLPCDAPVLAPFNAFVHAPSDAPVRALGLVPGGFLTLIARPEPENSVLEAVQGFSCRPRGKLLAVLGRYDDAHPYHRAVRAAASAEVRFLGAIYEPAVVQALRVHSLAYVHGHRVGGTNPSLVEALGAGNPVIAHDNRFNRWVAADAAHYFDGTAAEHGFDAVLSRLLADPPALQALARAARARFADAFRWPDVLAAYETLLLQYLR